MRLKLAFSIVILIALWWALYIFFQDIDIPISFDDGKRPPIAIGDIQVEYTTTAYFVNIPGNPEEDFCTFVHDEPYEDPTLTVTDTVTNESTVYKISTNDPDVRITLNGGITDPQDGFTALDLRTWTFTGECAYDEYFGILTITQDKVPYTLNFPTAGDVHTISLTNTKTSETEILYLYPMTIISPTSDWNDDGKSDYVFIEPYEKRDFKSRMMMWDILNNKPAAWFHDGEFVNSELTVDELDESLDAFIFAVEREQLENVYRYQVYK